jgi:hypothetical protein
MKIIFGVRPAPLERMPAFGPMSTYALIDRVLTLPEQRKATVVAAYCFST